MSEDSEEALELPPREQLARGGLDLMTRHFAALNSGDRGAFRDTAYLFDQNDGEPFERWWSGMRSLAPLSVELSLDSIRDKVSKAPSAAEAHVSVWVGAVATSATTGRTYSGRFVVWYLLESRIWKLGCRIHWWLP